MYTHIHTHTHTHNVLVWSLKIWKWQELIVVQCCMSCNNILHYFHTNSVSCHSYIELLIKKNFQIKLLRLFYDDIPVAEVMCNGRMDVRKLSEDVVWLQQWKQFTNAMYIDHYSLYTFIHTFPPLNVNWYRISENCRRPE